MRTVYFAAVGGFIGLLLYAGATGNFGIIPDLPFDLPFARHAQPTSNVLAAPVLVPQMTGSAGFTADQFVNHMREQGGKVDWERSKDDGGWIIRYAMTNELTGKDFAGAFRLTYLTDASQAGVSGPGLVLSAWAEDGQDMNAYQINYLLSQVAAGIFYGD